MLRQSFGQTFVCKDGYGDCFARARGRLESWMRGHPLDVALLAEDLQRLPDNVCQTLLRGLPPQLSSEVLQTVAQRRACA